MTNAEAEQSPLAQAEEMKARLDRAGVPAYLRILPGSEHALNGSNALNALPYTVVFFDRYLKSAPIPGAMGSERGPGETPARRPFVVAFLSLVVGAAIGAAAMRASARRRAARSRWTVR